jgi:hypothetical protein
LKDGKIFSMTSILLQGSESDIRLMFVLAKKLNLQARSLTEGEIKKLLDFPDNVEEEEWSHLSAAQQKGILDAIEQIDEGQGVVHEDVLNKYKKKHGEK